MTKPVRRHYKIIAISLCITLVASLLPRSVWGVNVAHAYATTLIPAVQSGIPEDVSQAALAALQEAPLSTELTGEMAALEVDSFFTESLAAPQQALQENLVNPLSISRVQSTYHAGATIGNTVVVTYTITNNQLPANLPQVAEGATLTDTVAALEQFQTQRADDPNAIRNVLLVDSLTTQGVFSSATPNPDKKNGEYAWNLGDIPPLSSITATLVLTVPTTVSSTVNLDNGAAAYGT